MIDGSHRSFEENVEVTSLVVAEAHGRGVWVEAELGRDRAGTRTSPARPRASRADLSGGCRQSSPSAQVSTRWRSRSGRFTASRTTPSISTSVCSIASPGSSRFPSCSTAHRASNQAELRAAVRGGVAKVNFNAELRRAYLGALRRAIDDASDDIVRRAASGRRGHEGDRHRTSSSCWPAVDLVARVSTVKTGAARRPRRPGG